MKRKSLITTLALAVIVSTFSGCGLKEATQTLNDITNTIKNESTRLAKEDTYTDKEQTYPEEYVEESPAAATSETGSESEACYDTAEYYCEEPMYDVAFANNFGQESFVGNTYNTEEYSAVKENGFKSVATSPLSTFSADVDTASYSNLRRMINSGYSLNEIPEGAVRIEEMINYFDYSYSRPRKGEPFSVNTEIATCPWNKEHQLMMLGLNTEAIDFADAPDSNLVFLIDVSGSMRDENKLPLLKQAFGMLIDNLSEKDTVSIVTYAGSDEILIKGVPASNKNKIMSALDSLEASGSTNGGEGIISAYNLAERYFIKGGNNRVLLATDGDFNVGITSQSDLYDLIDKEKDRGIFLSVLGFGMGNYSDTNMETLADAGNGNYAYIDDIREAKKVFVEELGATMVTVAKDVKFQVEFNPAAVKEYRLLGYENRVMADEDFDNDKKDAGEIGAGNNVTVLYEIVLNDEAAGSDRKLKYQDSTLSKRATASDELLTVSIRYKEPDENKSRLLEYPIGNEAYNENPSADFEFAGAVAEFGMILRNSEYVADGSLRHVMNTLNEIRLNDEYKQEFAELVETVAYNDYDSWNIR